MSIILDFASDDLSHSKAQNIANKRASAPEANIKKEPAANVRKKTTKKASIETTISEYYDDGSYSSKLSYEYYDDLQFKRY